MSLNRELKKIPITLFLIIFSTSLFSIQQSTNLERCIEKNVKNIVTFKIPTPNKFSYLKIKVTEDMEKDILNIFPGADVKILNTKTIGDMIELMNFDDQDTIDLIRQAIYTDELPEEEKKMFMDMIDFFGSIFKGYPGLLNEAAEDICNKQGVY